MNLLKSLNYHIKWASSTALKLACTLGTVLGTCVNDSNQTAINFLLKQKKKDKNIALNLQEKKYNKIKEEFKYKLIT